MKHAQIRKLVYTAICISLGLLLPQVNKIPGVNLGAILLPMHIPVLLAGLLCGIPYATFCGFILPLLNYVISGRPMIYPVGISMMFELATYGCITALLYRLTKGKVYISLIGAMIAGRIVMGIANTFLLGMSEKPYGFSVFLTEAFVNAIPGIAIQLIIIPVILYALKKAKLTELHESYE
ncbi:MAG: ECF transporter S component [Clostridiales bacterium]|nr:ECF transporter S component [Clostridiales bacterium]